MRAAGEKGGGKSDGPGQQTAAHLQELNKLLLQLDFGPQGRKCSLPKKLSRRTNLGPCRLELLLKFRTLRLASITAAKPASGPGPGPTIYLPFPPTTLSNHAGQNGPWAPGREDTVGKLS